MVVSQITNMQSCRGNGNTHGDSHTHGMGMGKIFSLWGSPWEWDGNGNGNSNPTATVVIADIEKCNLNVVVLCSDNLPLNQNLFKLFSRKHVIEQSVPHSCDPNRPLFLIFYFVHIIKCVRNNWLNQLNVVLFSLLLKILLTLIYQLLYPELPLKILGINTDLSTLPP